MDSCGKVRSCFQMRYNSAYSSANLLQTSQADLSSRLRQTDSTPCINVKTLGLGAGLHCRAKNLETQRLHARISVRPARESLGFRTATLLVTLFCFCVQDYHDRKKLQPCALMMTSPDLTPGPLTKWWHGENWYSNCQDKHFPDSLKVTILTLDKYASSTWQVNQGLQSTYQGPTT